MSYRSYSGIGFEVWNNARSWYWLVKNPAHGTGSIGAAPTEADAVGEACAAIEEISASEGGRKSMLRASSLRQRGIARLDGVASEP